MQFNLDDQLAGMLDELDEWATAQVQHAEQQTMKLDVSPTFLTPQDFWNAEGNANTDELHAKAIVEGAIDLLEETKFVETKDDPDDIQLNSLKAKLEACETLLSHVGHALSDLDRIELQHKLVADKTHSLHDVCKRLLAEQTKLDRVVTGIQGPMLYFTSYDDIAPRLGVKTENSDPRIKQRVLHPDDAQFKRDLSRLDECVAFLEAHPHYHDHDAYMKKFHGLQMQAMTMIKTWVIDEITRLAEFASNQTKLQTGASTSASFLDNVHLYGRFAEKGRIVRPATMELEKRPRIAVGAIKETLRRLCSLRYRLLLNAVTSSPEVQSKDPSLVSRILVGSAFLGRVCAAEYALVSTFFSVPAVKQILLHYGPSTTGLDGGDELLYATRDDDTDAEGKGNRGDDTDANAFSDEMESLCSCLYEAIRPLIVKEMDLEKLCDAASAIESAVQDLDSRMERDAVEPLERVLTRIAFDIQERLVFCSVRVIRDQVIGFEPSNEQLDPPGSRDGQPTDTWYPTLEITLSTLSKVYRCVEPNVFEQLASEAVSACTKSLCDAARRISKRSSPDDADLFLVKHLLILREQIAPFRAALNVKEAKLDFGSTSRALRQLFAQSSQSRRGDWVNLMRFAAPTVRESDFDTRKELDSELRRASEAFILRVSKRALGPLLEFVDASQAYLQQESATWEGLASQGFTSNESVTAAVAYCEKQTVEQVQAAKDKSVLYISNAQTRSVLFNAIEANAFKVANSAANFAMDLFKEDAALNDRLRELVRQVASLRGANLPTSPTPSIASRVQSPRATE